MNGLERARLLYEQFGKKLIKEQFPQYEDRIAAGLVGHGSECFGFDDTLSLDHDYDGGFCLFLTDEDDLKIGVALSRAYNELLKEHGTDSQKTLLGGNTRGVQTINGFYARYLGGNPLKTPSQWLCVPSYAIAEATNGCVFHDPLGEFSKMREILLCGEPQDTRYKRLAARLLTMAQSGQYNYARCIAHGEAAAAQHALLLFADAAGEAVFLLNGAHAPYYKWRYRAMKNLPTLSQVANDLETLLCGCCDRQKMVEKICADIAEELRRQGLSNIGDNFLEPHAFEVFKKITDRDLSSMHILEG